jgi:hypothetical protein
VLARLPCGFANGRSGHPATGATAPEKWVRRLRVQQQLSKTERPPRGMTQPAVGRFEAGGVMYTLLVPRRPAHSLGAELSVQLAQSLMA